MTPDLRLVHTAAAAAPADEQFRLLVSSVTDYAIYLLDGGGRVTSWNPGAERIKGYRADEVIGRNFSQFYAPEDRARGLPEAALATARRDGRFEGEGWRLRKDGSRFWAMVVIDAVRDDAGGVVGFAKITRDISERRAMEERLRESEERLRAFTSHSPALMCMKDREGRYRFVNDRFLERYSLRLDQVLGRTDAELFPRRLALAAAAHDAAVLARGEPLQYEERAAVSEGQRVSLVSKFPVLDAAGTVVAVGTVANDITDRRLTEQALREQRTLLAEAQKVAGLGSWEWDPDTGRVSWSSELYRILGVLPQDLAPSFENYLERVHPEDRQQSGAMVARALMDSRSFSMLERIVRPGGEVRYLRSQGEVVRNERGKPIKILVACVDITEQRHSESALRQAAQDLHGLTRRLVQAEEAERRRLARELHDRVGQSLSALNINLDIISRESQALTPALRQRLDDSLGLVDNTLQSIENVMAELRPPLLDEYGLGAALGWHAEEFSRRTGVKVAVADRDPAGSKNARPEAAVALFRIAQEALNNVLKHAKAANVRLEVSATDEELILDVQDDGQGFDPATAGRGRWGMTTMRERAEAAGGQLHIASSPGEGTRIHARVPL
ncbi:MAG TPA: PAS domain S-box protein [Burkholderiales bacterium]|nr:PAS domain S-box protein [Burkholderiales bacterium]